MKILFNRLSPLLLAFCLWSVGNLVVISTPAKGQTEVAQNYGVCVKDEPSPYTISYSNCSGTAGSGCKGYCYYYTFDTSTCDYKQQGSKSDPCTNGRNAVFKNYVLSNCRAIGDNLNQACHCNTDKGEFIDLGEPTTDTNYNTCVPPNTEA